MASTVNKRGFPWRLMGVLEAAASDGRFELVPFRKYCSKSLRPCAFSSRIGEYPPLPALTARKKKMNVLRGCGFDLHLGEIPVRQGPSADPGHLLGGGDSDTPASEQERGLRVEPPGGRPLPLRRMMSRKRGRFALRDELLEWSKRHAT